jgi:hypothetical protein
MKWRSVHYRNLWWQGTPLMDENAVLPAKMSLFWGWVERTELSVSWCDKSPQSERDHGTMIPDHSHRRQEKSLVRTLRQVSPEGDSFTQPRTGTVMGGTRLPTGNWRCGHVVPRNRLPPLTRGRAHVSAREFRSVEGLHPPGIFNSNEKRILPSAAIRKRIHFCDCLNE